MSQRTRFLVDPDVQWAIIRRMLTHWSLALLALLSLGVVVNLIYAPGDRSLHEACAASFSAQIPLLCILFMLMPVYVWDVVRLSHRFAGPMFRLRGVFRDLANGGRAPRLRFRPGDFWHQIAEDFNVFYQSHLELKERCELLEKELERATGKEPSLSSAKA